jgi:hypothetical protein
MAGRRDPNDIYGDPNGLLARAIKRLTTKEFGNVSRTHQSDSNTGLPGIVGDFINQAVTGQKVSGQPIMPGRYNPRSVPDTLYTNPIMAALNDARDKAFQAHLIPFIDYNSPAVRNQRSIRPNHIQSPRDATASSAPSDVGYRVAMQARQLAENAAREGNKAGGKDLPGTNVFASITNSLGDLGKMLAGLGVVNQARQAAEGAIAGAHRTGWGTKPDNIIDDSAIAPDYNYSLPSTPMPNAPKPVELKRNDFSKKAGDLVESAYGPQYAALSEAVDNTKTRGRESDQMLAGLYTQLTNADVAAQHQAQTQGAANVAAAKKNVGIRTDQAAAGYDDTAQRQAALLKSMGMEGAAADLLKQGVSDSGWAQNQAANMANAQTDYMKNQGTTQEDYYRRTAGADKTTGIATRQANQRDLRDILSGYDQQRMEIGSQQAQDTLNLGNQMSDQDFQLQQANYGIGQDSYQNALNAWQAQQNAGLQAAQLDLQRQGMSADDAYKWATLQAQQQQAAAAAQQAADNTAYQRQRDTIADQHWDASNQLDESRFITSTQMDAARLELQRREAENTISNNPQNRPTPDVQTVADITRNVGDPKVAQQAYNLVQGLAQYPENTQSLPAFIQAAQAQAQAYGVDSAAATTAAIAAWNNIYKGNLGQN